MIDGMIIFECHATAAPNDSLAIAGANGKWDGSSLLGSGPTRGRRVAYRTRARGHVIRQGGEGRAREAERKRNTSYMPSRGRGRGRQSDSPRGGGTFHRGQVSSPGRNYYSTPLPYHQATTTMPSTLISRIINNITKHHQPTIPYAQQLSTQPPLSDPTTTTTRARSRSKSILFDNDFITSQAYKSLKPLIQSSSPNAKDSSLSHSWMKEKGTRKKAKPKAINFFGEFLYSRTLAFVREGMSSSSSLSFYNLVFS